MRKLPPVVWISLGLVSLMLSFILVGDLLVDLVPDDSAKELDYRTSLSEALAGQYSQLAAHENHARIAVAMHALVRKNDEIVSAALQRTDGTILAQAGPHDEHWIQPAGMESTFNHVQVPIFDGDAPWGTLQVAFRPAESAGLWGLLSNPWVRFLALVGGLGFVGYLFFMKRTLRHLDPSAVIPKRVQATLDVLAEGVVLLDTLEFIVLANASFTTSVGREGASLLGLELDSIPWENPNPEVPMDIYPWTRAMREGKPVMGVMLELRRPNGESTKFNVNSVPILDDHANVRGVLASFDDITELDGAINSLLATMKESKELQGELVRQNEELERLATRDALTGCLNRRVFFEKTEAALLTSQQEGSVFGCLLVDIDQCKSFNDRYGYAVGDQVINVVARSISTSLRSTDILCRFEGEVFCVILPNMGVPEAAQVAERIRQKIESKAGSSVRAMPGLSITSSIGVSSTTLGASDPLSLIDQANKALVVAKSNGGNGVMCWDASGTVQPPPSKEVTANIATLVRLHRQQGATGQHKRAPSKKSPPAQQA